MLVGPLLGDPEDGFNPVTRVSEVDSSLFEYWVSVINQEQK